MFIKKNDKEHFGLPYQGSKAKLVHRICKMFPGADNFYDLFGGGFSVTHYMLKYRKNSFKEFHFNELRPGICELIKDAINGKYNFNVFKPEWISREKFMNEKESNAYIKIIWSFGNNGENYIFGKDIEKEKRSMHQAVVFNEFDSTMKRLFNIDKWPNDLSITAKRLLLKKICAKRIDLQQLEQLERLERLERLEQLERLERLHFTNLDYRQVEIKQNSIIYCDIPYKSTADYGSNFNHKEFYNWADNQLNPVFISEYGLDDNRFTLLKEFSHRSTYSSTKNTNGKTTERLFNNKTTTH